VKLDIFWLIAVHEKKKKNLSVGKAT